ncbi:MAG: YdhR family protein [Ilumatobacteraceae bacterium]
MITAFIQFTPPAPVPVDRHAELARANAPLYQDKPGLIRKYYVRSEDGTTVGGIYLWESREAAEATYDDAWHERVTEAYGSPPSITYLPTPVVVDNRHGETVE